MKLTYRLIRPLLFAMEAERAHGLTISLLKTAKYWPFGGPSTDPALNVEAFGLTFPNPIGVAAGLDKNAEVPDALLHLGFGFTEIGTVTPRPQPGNPLPRLFRLIEDEGVINRFGFNSEGHTPVYQRLDKRRGKPGIIGVNVGANKESTDRIADYVSGVRAFSDVADYFTINISSPNTPGLRDLQRAAELEELISRLQEAREETRDKTKVPTPLLLKIAPDLALAELDDIVRVCRDKKIDGMVVANTTISRSENLHSPEAAEAGGLSGKPLFDRATRALAQTYLRVEGQFPLVGAGGIHDASSAIAKIEAGATLLQVYSALVYSGPALVGEVKEGLRNHLESSGLSSPSQVTGTRAADWARIVLPE